MRQRALAIIILMQRERWQAKGNPEQWQKQPAKKIINFRKKIIMGQSSAQCPKRSICRKEGSPPKHPNRVEYLTRTFSDEQIRNSFVYKLLEKEFRETVEKQDAELAKLRQLKADKLKLIHTFKAEQYTAKLQLWELRDEAMRLKDSIQEEHHETIHLMEELGIQPEESSAPQRSSEDLV